MHITYLIFYNILNINSAMVHDEQMNSKLKVVHKGIIGRFSIFNLLVAFTTSLGLLVIANFVTDHVMF